MRAGHVEAETDTNNDDIKTHMTSALLHPPEHTDTNTRARGPFQFPVKRLLSIEDFGVMAPKVQATMPLAVEFQTCHLCEGTKKFATSYLLYEHLRTYHRVSTESMQGTEVHQEWKAARSRQNAPTTKANTKTITSQEILAVGVVPGDAKRFECRLCEKTFSKNSAIEHFTGPRHRMPRSIVTSWLVAVDQRALKKQKPHDNLGRALAEEKELQDSFAPAEQQVAVPVGDGMHALHDDAVLIRASGEQHTLPPASRPEDRLAAKRGDDSSEPSRGAVDGVMVGPLHTTTAVVLTATPPLQTIEVPTLPLPKKRRFFTNEQKVWIRNQSQRDIADPSTDVGSQKYFDELRQRGIADKVLDEGHTSSAMRSHMRTYRDQLQTIAAEEEKRRKRNEKRQAKRDAARSQPSSAEPSQSPLTFIRPTQDQVTALFASCVGRTKSLDTDFIDPSATGSELVSVPMVLDD